MNEEVVILWIGVVAVISITIGSVLHSNNVTQIELAKIQAGCKP